jgi:RNA polymerase sigma-70 factor (ECF subfamily)
VYIEKWDEAVLVDAAQNGSLDAFNALILHYQTRVYNLARYIMHDDAAADDMAQEAFITAYRSLSKFKGGSFQAWILRVVTNRCYDELRRYKRNPSTSLDAFTDLEEAVNPYMVDHSPTPEKRLEQQELRKLIDRGLSILPEEQRIVIVLVDRLGCNYDEVVRITRTTLGTVKSRLYRARKRMQEFLLGEGLNIGSLKPEVGSRLSQVNFLRSEV